MEVALGMGSLVLLAGGVTAMVRRSMRPAQALAVLGIAVGVALLELLAEYLATGRDLGHIYVFAVVATTTLAGIIMAVGVVGRPPPRIR